MTDPVKNQAIAFLLIVGLFGTLWFLSERTQERRFKEILQAVEAAAREGGEVSLRPPLVNNTPTIHNDHTITLGAETPTKSHLSAAAFARLHGVNEWTVRDWIKNGKIDPPPEKGTNGYWQIDRAAVVSP